MTEQQKRFVEYYLGEAKRNGSEAARLAGYSIDRARQTAYDLLTTPEIAQEVARQFESMTMTSEEAAKQLSDIAGTRLNDYFKVVKVQGREQSEQLVTVLMEHAREEIETIERFIETENLDEKERKPFDRQIKKLRETMLDYQIDIDKYGNLATRLALGKPVVIERVELDLVALANAKELGRIKSYQMTEFGPKVELESASSALAKILEYHGKIIQKHQLLGKNGKPAKMKVTLNLGGPALTGNVSAQ